MKLTADDMHFHADRLIEKYQRQGYNADWLYTKVMHDVSRYARGKKYTELAKYVAGKVGV